MPLSLVLHATFTTWHREMRRLNDWNQLVDLEETLLDRARGAFMARWFGTALPLYMGELRIVIANIDELRTRYQELRRQAGGGTNASELNLTEPLAGITGTLAGSLLSPTSSIMLLAVIDEQMPHWYTTLAAALNALTFGAVGVLVAGVAGPAVILGVPYWALTQPDQAYATHDFLGVLAGFFVAARQFIEQIVGPRDAVHNPLLGQLLDLLSGFATLLPFVFAFGAFVVTWLGPRLAPLAKQLDALIDLAQGVFVLLGDVVNDLLDTLGGLFSGNHSLARVLHGVMDTMTAWWGATRDRMGALGAAGAKAAEALPVGLPPGTLGAARYEIPALTALKDAFGNQKLRDFVEEMTTKSWLVLRAQEAADRLKHIAAIFDRLDMHPVAKPKPGFFARQFGKIKDRQIAKATDAIPPWPTDLKFPDAPTIWDFPSFADYLSEEKLKAPGAVVDSSKLMEAFRKPGGDGFAFTLGDDAKKALAKIERTPPDVFAGERKALFAGQPPGQTAAKFMQEARATEAKLRTMLFAIIDTLLPAAARDEVPKLQGMLWELDAALYDKKAEFPVRDLPIAEALDVKVGKVRVQAPGQHREAVRAWGRDLRTALQGQRYGTLVPSAA